ncbi:CLUMA_CG001886, isoform A [Clunio marinus]|uniref:CLUMA_CG001886, isoform A n=1 Tax=Clunio marinus TaxID=568069 RepID=A0A1J1HJA7_9DIPT|nr:CLUMA_CG001886, isoform A [Clunio marinus]
MKSNNIAQPNMSQYSVTKPPGECVNAQQHNRDGLQDSLAPQYREEQDDRFRRFTNRVKEYGPGHGNAGRIAISYVRTRWLNRPILARDKRIQQHQNRLASPIATIVFPS